MNLSSNFTLSEAIKSQTALRLGIDNSPPSELLPSMIAVAANILEPCRANWARPIIASSWYRCEELEKAICWNGRTDSAFGRWCVRHDLEISDENWKKYFLKKSHSKGEAVDFEVPYVANIRLARWIEANLEFDQLILEFWNPDDPRGGWVHCSFAEKWNRKQILTIDKSGIHLGLPE